MTLGRKPVQWVLAALAMVMIWPVAAANPASELLEPGAYEMRDLDDGSKTRICLKDARSLVQISNAAAKCEHFMVESTLKSRTVRYSCQGSDWGMTRIRAESDRLGRVESQGIRAGEPFQIRAELRYAGQC